MPLFIPGGRYAANTAPNALTTEVTEIEIINAKQKRIDTENTTGQKIDSPERIKWEEEQMRAAQAIDRRTGHAPEVYDDDDPLLILDVKQLREIYKKRGGLKPVDSIVKKHKLLDLIKGLNDTTSYDISETAPEETSDQAEAEVQDDTQEQEQAQDASFDLPDIDIINASDTGVGAIE